MEPGRKTYLDKDQPAEAQPPSSDSPATQSPEPQPHAPRPARWPAALALLPLVLACLLLGSLVPFVAGHWRATRAYPFQIDAEEGFILGQALTLAQGGSIYRPLDRPPFLVGNYTPLFPWIFSLTQGPQATLASLPQGRLLVQLAALGAALALAAIVALRTRRLLPALLAALLLLISYEVFHWSAFVRVDLPALFLTLAGLGVFLLVRARWGLVLAALLFVAAAYTRQTALLAPLACLLALAFHDRRALPWFLVPLAGVGLLALAILQWRTGGEFYRHVVTYNQNRMDWVGWARVMKNEIWFFYRGWIVALVVLAAARLALWRKSAKVLMEESTGTSAVAARFTELPHARHATGLYALLAAGSLLAYAKIGAAPNYALEPLAAAALWGMESFGRLLDRLERPTEKTGRATRRWGLRLALWTAALLLLAHAGLLWRAAHQFRWSALPTPADRAIAGEIVRLARQTPGDVLIEEPVFTMLAGKPVLLQPFITAQLAREGQWDDTPLIQMLRNKRFGLVVVTEDLAAARAEYERYTARTAEALRRHYDLRGQVILPGLGRRYFLWTPALKTQN